LEEIPLDYIEKAIKWLLNQKNVDKEKLAMMGTSKGAELTLLSASLFPEIKMVIATSPSGAVSQAINRILMHLPNLQGYIKMNLYLLYHLFIPRNS